MSDPADWSVAAEEWGAWAIGIAGYTRWRQAEALLAAPLGGRAAAAAVLSIAADLAQERSVSM